MKFQIYCYSCGENHEFDTVDIEQIIYSMQAELATALREDHAHSESATSYDQFKGDGGEKPMFCIKQHHWGEMMDQEAFGEWVHSQVELRRCEQGTKYCLDCGQDEPLCQCEEPDLQEPNP